MAYVELWAILTSKFLRGSSSKSSFPSFPCVVRCFNSLFAEWQNFKTVRKILSSIVHNQAAVLAGARMVQGEGGVKYRLFIYPRKTCGCSVPLPVNTHKSRCQLRCVFSSGFVCLHAMLELKFVLFLEWLLFQFNCNENIITILHW